MMFQGMHDETIKLPPPEPLPNDTEDAPFFFIGDDAFPLRQHMLKPFSARYLESEQLVFNYRNSSISIGEINKAFKNIVQKLTMPSQS